MCSLCEGKTDCSDLLQLARTERDAWRAEYHKQRVAAENIALATLHDVRHDFDKILNEFRSRYGDSASHELINELDKRLGEGLNLLIPTPEVRASGK